MLNWERGKFSASKHQLTREFWDFVSMQDESIQKFSTIIITVVNLLFESLLYPFSAGKLEFFKTGIFYLAR